MALTTTREGMRNALAELRSGRDPGIAAAEFTLKYREIDRSHIGGRLSSSSIRESWAGFGVEPGERVAWVVDYTQTRLTVRVTFPDVAPAVVDLMAD